MRLAAVSLAVSLGLAPAIVSAQDTKSDAATADPVVVQQSAEPVTSEENTGDAKPADGRQPEIEVVFVLDTTGSMSGLIAAAKDKVWAIANTLATAKPTPVIRFGLIGYRDKGDDYVTRHFQLSDDLDTAYTDLFDYEAQGGGDTPEAVNRALNEAITQIKWSPDPHIFRVIYLVGDCPPHENEEGEVPYIESCKLALERDIVINTIQCGSHAETTPIWKEIAKLAHGEFSQIAQSGGLVVMETPFDEELAELSAKRDATRVWFGSEEELARQTTRIQANAAVVEESTPAQKARRGVYNAAGSGVDNFYNAPAPISGKDEDKVKELVLTIIDGKFDDSNADQVKLLPAEWKELTPEQRQAKAKEIAAERDALAKKIKELNEKRQAYIKEELKKRGEETPELDKALFDSITEQAGEKGFGGFGGAPSF